jgi:ATP adenylyltransferase
VKKLWAPWRMAYIQQSKPKGCIFCTKPKANQDPKTFILFRSTYSYVMMNVYPYNNSHLLVSPYRHVDRLEKLKDPELLDLVQTTNRSTQALRKAISPEGFNIGVNVGKVAGAGIKSHVHVHIVPRWNGDTNFMPVLAESRVIPQHLTATFKTLLPFFKKNGKKRK